MKYICTVCGWEYDESEGCQDNNVAPGTEFSSLNDDFECPLCGAGRDRFNLKQEGNS